MRHILIVDLLGTDVSDEEKTIIMHPYVGGLLLFSRNVVDPEQLRRLIGTIRSLRPDIFIAIDHEGGNVQRVQRHGFRSLPAARVYGDVFDINPEAGIRLATQYGEIMANDLLHYGIDVSFAPVLDLDGVSRVIGKLDRAFHRDPTVVALLATAFIQGMNKAGMPATGKHFPGHGSISSDSHLSKPIVDVSMETLRETDLKPFIDLISHDLLAAVMPAHVTYTAIDADNPAGFSRSCLQGVLRDTLHFKGLVVSDCLGMVGADIGNMNERVNQALEAGCDMLIVCNQSRALLSRILQTVSFVQTQESADRIDAFKAKMARFSCQEKDTIKPYLSQAMHMAMRCRVADVSEHEVDTINNTTSV